MRSSVIEDKKTRRWVDGSTTTSTRSWADDNKCKSERRKMDIADGYAMKETDEKITVMQHFAKGDKVEVSDNFRSWYNDDDPAWNWRHYTYRIKEQG